MIEDKTLIIQIFLLEGREFQDRHEDSSYILNRNMKDDKIIGHHEYIKSILRKFKTQIEKSHAFKRMRIFNSIRV